MDKYRILHVHGREILDSRGNPTVEAEVILVDGSMGRASVPSGASTGEYEALELRDGDVKRYLGKGVTKAIRHINEQIAKVVIGLDARDIYKVDEAMLSFDGTEDKSNLGANAILAVSLATARAASNALGISLYRFLGGVSAKKLPVPMMNILNGGAHAANNIDIQEFMIVPVGASSFHEALQWCTEVYHTLASILKERGLSIAVGDEGGFAPDLSGEEEAIELIVMAVEKAGFQMYRDFMIALDAAASEWKGLQEGRYILPKCKKVYSTESLIEHWKYLSKRYPIFSIEDALDEKDWMGWKKLTQELGNKVQLVGDDLFVTNTSRLQRGIKNGSANSILIKLNQIGTLSETIDAIKMAQEAGYTAIVSHRSGETEDTTIADLSVALGTGQIKTGAPSRTERVAKYNRLLRIEEELESSANYPKMRDFFEKRNEQV